MTTYHYDTHYGSGTFSSENDEVALAKLREAFGQELLAVKAVWTEESSDDFRTVWME